MNAHEEFEEQEVLLSEQPTHLWRRRKQELLHWTERDKRTVSPKRTVIWNGVEVDAELVRTLSLLQEAGVQTEFSCAGVSPLDEPVEHSLYAYVTLIQSQAAEQFVNDAIVRMRNRLWLLLRRGGGDMIYLHFHWPQSQLLLVDGTVRARLQKTKRSR